MGDEWNLMKVERPYMLVAWWQAFTMNEILLEILLNVFSAVSAKRARTHGCRLTVLAVGEPSHPCRPSGARLLSLSLSPPVRPLPAPFPSRQNNEPKAGI